ncbi:MAG: hypothetical protein J6386_17490 [Candidatus Synoicihabitans palmerolidicus]|nr:hypothetical protein [Candidatus Synoicihabitans palmerolidicus]
MSCCTVWAAVAESPAIFASIPLEERGFPAVRSFIPRDYRGHNQIWAIVEGPDGLMYFAAHSEVMEFDGITWRKIPIPGGAFIRALKIDDDNVLWTGGVNDFGRIRPDANGQLTFESLRLHLPAHISEIGDIRTINLMPDGVYFQTHAYLLRWAHEALSIWEMQEDVVCLAHPGQDRLIVCRGDRWQIPIANGAWEDVP